ncbi:unnamed protein product [Caenorhabditis auriculariae]|uniref:G-protein coupled receptors family 1 profile domain-containing protein n=1 Tax=Caenorhabditis auriculariae TaxID=2777116 RepID=A0A8S1HRP2_9PELO|nr:unnamed protein product [Caenorhabditis auriculariae]
MSMTWSDFNQQVIFYEILIFNVVGHFGNFHILYITYRFPKLRAKSAYLQCILSVFHSLCLLSTLANALFILFDMNFTRRQCYPILAPYIFCICAQAVLMLVLPSDILFAILFPHKYRNIGTFKYIVVMMIGPVIYSTFFMVWGFVKMDDDPIDFCNPPTGLHPTVTKNWMMSNVFINSVVLALFIFLILMVKIRGDAIRKERKKRVVRRLLVLMGIFICSWYICMAGVFMTLLSFQGLRQGVIHANFIIFALICYSQSFYVIIWRSKEHRAAFFHIWNIDRPTSQYTTSSGSNPKDSFL